MRGLISNAQGADSGLTNNVVNDRNAAYRDSNVDPTSGAGGRQYELANNGVNADEAALPNLNVEPTSGADGRQHENIDRLPHDGKRHRSTSTDKRKEKGDTHTTNSGTENEMDNTVPTTTLLTPGRTASPTT